MLLHIRISNLVVNLYPLCSKILQNMIWVTVKAGFGAPFCPNGKTPTAAMTLQQVDDCDFSPTCFCWISLFHLSIKLWICTNFLPDQFIIFLIRVSRDALLSTCESPISTWILPGSEMDSRLRTSWRVSMLNSPICPSVKDATRWAGSLHTRSTEEGTPSSCAQKRRHIHVSHSTKANTQKKKKKNKTNHDTLLSSLSTASAGEVVLASHSLTVPSAEQERRRWCALLYTKPQTESVCPHNAPRSIDGSARGGTGQQPWFNSNGHHVQTKKGGRCFTVGVVRVDVGIGGVPALYGSVYTSAETLLPRAAHHHAQYSPPVVQIRLNIPTSCHIGFFGLSISVIFFPFTCGLWMCRWVPRLETHSCGQIMSLII